MNDIRWKLTQPNQYHENENETLSDFCWCMLGKPLFCLFPIRFRAEAPLIFFCGRLYANRPLRERAALCHKLFSWNSFCIYGDAWQHSSFDCELKAALGTIVVVELCMFLRECCWINEFIRAHTHTHGSTKTCSHASWPPVARTVLAFLKARLFVCIWCLFYI